MFRIFILVLTLAFMLSCGSDENMVNNFNPKTPPGGIGSTIIVFVDASKKTGNRDGTTWANAYTDLQEGINKAEENGGGKVYVAVGTYKPSSCPSSTDRECNSDRKKHFALKNNVWVQGGYKEGDKNGTPTGKPKDTILNGSSYEVYHVFYHTGGLTKSAKLQNVTITGGHADTRSPDYKGDGIYNSISSPYDKGGGMYNSSSSPTLIDVTFKNNTANHNGGGMYNSSSSPTLTDVTFKNNTANHNGGGMYNNDSSPRLTDVTFTSNTAEDDGGGMYNEASSLTLTGGTFTDNKAINGSGGGMCNYNTDTNSSSQITLTNIDFKDNIAKYSGGGMYNEASSLTLTGGTFTDNKTIIGSGGGMYNTSSDQITLTDVAFEGNTAIDGGGICNSSSSLTLTRCTFTKNKASYHGGAIYSDNSSTRLIEVKDGKGNPLKPTGAIKSRDNGYFNPTIQ